LSILDQTDIDALLASANELSEDSADAPTASGIRVGETAPTGPDRSG
jgi:hypothetical protein